MLRITQPAVTHQIRSLEDELGVKLFHRSTRSVELTHAGTLFLNDARGILEISLRAKRRFEEISNREILPIDVGCQTHVQLFTLKDVLRRLRDIYPNLHPRFMVQPLPHLLKALDEESVDVIIGFKEKDTRKTSASYREICQVPLVCVCSPESPLARKSQVTVQDLQEEKLVLNNPIQLPTELIHFQNDLLNGRSPWDFYFCEAPESVLTLVEAGYGISLLPSLLLPPDGRLIHLPVDGGPVFSYGLYFKDMLNNPVLKEFIHLLRQTDLSQL